MPVLDTDILTALKGLEKASDVVSFLADLIDTFIRESPAVLEALLASLRQGNSLSARHSAHQLKGLASNLGIRKLAALAEFIEAEVEAGRLPDSDSVKSLLEGYRREAIERLQRDWRP